MIKKLKNNEKIGLLLIFIYVMCVFLSFFTQNYYLLSGEHLVTNNPKVILDNLIFNFDWNNNEIIRHSDMPRGMHQSPINNIIFYFILQAGKIIYLNSLFTQIFFGVALQIVGLNLIIGKILDNNFKLKVLIIIAYILNYQNIELMLGGGFYLINHGLILLFYGFFYRLIYVENRRKYLDLIALVIISILLFYSAIVWINLIILFLIGVFFNIFINKVKVITTPYIISSLICILLIMPYALLIIKNPLPYSWDAPKSNFYYAATSGFFKTNVFDISFLNIMVPCILIISIIILLYKYSVQTNNYSIIFLYLFIVIWETTDLGTYILLNVPLFHYFRSTYKLTFISTLLLFIATIKVFPLYFKNKVNIILFIFIFYESSYLIMNYKIFNFIEIPQAYSNLQNYVNNLSGKKLLLPHSDRDQSISNSYSWISHKPSIGDYPSNIFATIYPISELVDFDEIDNASKKKSEGIMTLRSSDKLRFLDLIKKNCIQYVINDTNKYNKFHDFTSTLSNKDIIYSEGGIDIYKTQLNCSSPNKDKLINLSTYFSRFHNLKVNFLKKNLGTPGLRDYIADRTVLNLFSEKFIDPSEIFEVSPLSKSRQPKNSCFESDASLSSIVFYDVNNLDFPSNLILRNRSGEIISYSYLYEDFNPIRVKVISPSNSDAINSFCFSNNNINSTFFKLIY